MKQSDSMQSWDTLDIDDGTLGQHLLQAHTRKQTSQAVGLYASLDLHELTITGPKPDAKAMSVGSLA